MTCECQFLVIKPITRWAENNMRIEKEGVLCVCPKCGEIIEVWEDGEIQTKTNKWQNKLDNKKS